MPCDAARDRYAQAPFAKQFGDISAAYFYLLSSYGGDLRPVFKRYFLSDAANQIAVLRAGESPIRPVRLP